MYFGPKVQYDPGGGDDFSSARANGSSASDLSQTTTSVRLTGSMESAPRTAAPAPGAVN